MNTFKIWITMMLPGYASSIAYALIREGFSLTKLGNGTGELSEAGNPAAMWSITAIGEPKPKGKTEVASSSNRMYHAVKEILLAQGVMYYSMLVISDDTSSTWNIGNIDMQKLAKQAEEVDQVKEKKKIDDEISAAMYGPGAKLLT